MWRKCMRRQNPLNVATSFISSIFAPIVPALAGAGILVHGTWNSLVSAGEAVTLFGIIPLYLVSYTSSVIPIVLVLLVQAPLERWLNKAVPGAVRLIFVPMITFLVMGVLALSILGPIGAMVGQGLSVVFLWLGENASWAPPLIVGALFPVMVMFGVHHGVAPVGTMSIMQLGYDAIWGPGIVCSNIAQRHRLSSGQFFTSQKQPFARGQFVLKAHPANFDVAETVLHLGVGLRRFGVLLQGGDLCLLPLDAGGELFEWLILQPSPALVGGGSDGRLALAALDDFRVKVRAWLHGRIVASFLPASGQRKSRKPFNDFLLGGAAGGRLVFGCKGSGQRGPKGDSLINGNLSMDIHSCHIRLIISLNHTQKFPTISFIKTCMVCNQIDRSNSFRFHIFHNNIK